MGGRLMVMGWDRIGIVDGLRTGCGFAWIEIMGRAKLRRVWVCAAMDDDDGRVSGWRCLT